MMKNALRCKTNVVDNPLTISLVRVGIVYVVYRQHSTVLANAQFRLMGQFRQHGEKVASHVSRGYCFDNIFHSGKTHTFAHL